MSLYDLDEALGLNDSGLGKKAAANLIGAYGENPDDHAERVRLQKATGTPAVLMGDLTVKDEAKKQQYMNGLAISHAPATTKFAADENNAPLITDDVSNLTAFEKMVKNTKAFWNDAVAPTPARALAAYQKGVGGMYQWVGDSVVQPLINVLTTEGMKERYGRSNWLSNTGAGMVKDAKNVEEQINREHNLDPNSWTGATASALQSMYLQAPFMISGGALANTARQATAFALGGMGLTTGGQTYGERREKGFSPAASGWSAAWDATVEVGTELLPTKTLFEMMKPAAKQSFARMGLKLVEFYGEETFGELIATLFQDANDRFMDKPDMTLAERVDKIGEYFKSGEAYQNAVNTFKSTLIQTTLMGGAGVGINRLQQGRFAKTEQAHQQLIDTLTSAEAVKLKERSPETFSDFAQQVGDHHGISTIYLQANRAIEEAVKAGIPEQEIPAWMARYGVTPEELHTALQTGGHVQLEIGKVATNFSSDAALQALQKDLLVNPNATSLADAETGAQVELEHLKHLDELYQLDKDRKINQDDIAAWEEAILNSPGLKGRVTSDSLMPLIARANVLSSLTGTPAIEHLNRMLQPNGLQVMKFKDFEAARNKERDAIYDFGTIYNALSDEGGKTVVKGKSSSGNWSESEFSKHLEQFYPAVHSLYLMHGHNKAQILAAVKNAAEGKQLNENHAAIVKAFKDDLDNQASIGADADLPFQRNFSSPNSRQGIEALSIRNSQAQGMLIPASVKDGKVLAAGVGATHYDVHSEVKAEIKDGVAEANGFVTPDGKFLDRKESLQWLKENRPDIYKVLDKETKKNGLESQSYAHAEGFGGDLADEAQRYMESLGFMQKNQQSPLGALTQDSGQNIITLFEKADKSTFLHETAHIFLNDLRYVAENLGVQQKEWSAVKEWLGVGEDGKLTVEQHEKFAEHFEVYLMEGKAPTPELRNAFRAFKRWLTKIYEAVTSKRQGQREGVTVNPELADLFDRLLATEEEIKATREQDALIAMLDDKLLNETGFTQAQVDEYRAIVNQAEDAARERMDKHKLVGRDERLKQWKKAATEEAAQQPVYAFQDVVKEQGINKESAQAQFGELPDSKVFTKDGLDINVAIAEQGEQFGYTNAAQFIEDLQHMPPRQQWIEKRMAQMEAAYDFQQDTQEAVRTASLRRQLEIESEWLAKQAEKDINAQVKKAGFTPRSVMRAWAENVVAGRTIKQISNIGKLIAESRKHRQQAIALARKGEWADALKSNEQSRLAEELIAASYKAMNAWDSIQANWRKISKWTNDNKNVKIGERYRDQINRLLTQYGIAKKEFDPGAPDLHSFAAMNIDDLDGTGAVLPAWVGVDTADFNTLKWEQLQDLNDALKYLYGNGRDEVNGLKTSKGEYVADVANDIVAKQDGLKNKSDLKSDATRFGKLMKNVQQGYRRFFANTAILRYIAQRMDGYMNVGSRNNMGPAEQLVQNVIGGMAKSNDLWVAIDKEVQPALATLMKNSKQVFSDITWPELLKREGDSWTKGRVVAAALNMGNDSNLMKLMQGYGLNDEDIHTIASKLTAEEWQAIQKIWDAVDSLWPQIADVHERLKYYRPKKIQARPLTVTTADGQQVELRGGYYPVKYDSRLTRQIAQWNEKDDILATHEAILQVPAAKSGFAKERTGVAYPVDLSLNVLAQHFNDTIRFITLSEAVRDADRVFNNANLIQRNTETLGRDMVDMVRPALREVLRPAPRQNGWFERSRVAMSMYYMGYNAWTAIQNITGVFPAIRQAGISNYLGGIAHIGPHWLDALKAMNEASNYMRLREANIERDMKKQLRDFNISGMEINGKRYTFDDVRALGFAGIRLVDTMVSLPAWWGTYNAEMEKNGGDTQKAIEAADAVVNKALGSGLAIDSTNFGRHPFLSLLAPFMSFASTQQEVMSAEYGAWKAGKINTSEFLYGNLMTWLAPSIASTFLQGILMYGIMGAIGGGDDKHEKDFMDYLTDLVSYRLMGVPFIRDVWNALLQGFEHKAPVTSARMPITEGYKMLQQFSYRVGQLDGSEKTTKAAMWSAAEIASLYAGIPASRIYDRWMKGQKNIESGHGWWGNHFIPQENKKK